LFGFSAVVSLPHAEHGDEMVTNPQTLHSGIAF